MAYLLVMVAILAVIVIFCLSGPVIGPRAWGPDPACRRARQSRPETDATEEKGKTSTPWPRRESVPPS